MTPYYEHDGITIYHGNCFTVLPILPCLIPDAVITDPPYGIADLDQRIYARASEIFKDNDGSTEEAWEKAYEQARDEMGD